MTITIDEINLETLLSMIDGIIEVAGLVAAGRLPVRYLAERKAYLSDQLADLLPVGFFVVKSCGPFS